MERALIVSATEKSIEFFSKTLEALSCTFITVVRSCAEARRILIENDFDICIINAPLSDETGERLSQNISSKGICQVVLCVASEFYEQISEHVENYGVITVSKPVSRELFWSAVKLAKAAQIKMRNMQRQNSLLIKKIEDLRLINRAKCLLIECLDMTEDEAHKHIEKQAMDLRITKKEVAVSIIRTYENV